MTDALEVRIAHLEGAYEQVDKRLGSMDSTLIHLRSDINRIGADLNSSAGQLRSELVSSTNQLRSELTARMDSQFHWLLGTIFTSWVTLLLAVFFRH